MDHLGVKDIGDGPGGTASDGQQTRLQKIREMISENATLTPEYLVMNLLATIVASYGLIQNSTAVVIGAMIIAMLLGPINGLALALNDSNWGLLRKAGISEALGVGVVLAASMVIGRMHADIPLGSEVLARTQPNILDLFIALAGGAAGAYALISPKLQSGAVGVAIATALVPPLSTCGILVARGGGDNMRLALGAFLLFFTNLVTIQAAASAVFWFRGLHAPIRSADQGLIELCRRNGISLGLIVILGGFLLFTFQSSVEKTTRELRLKDMVSMLIRAKQEGAAVADFRIEDRDGVINIFTVVRSPISFSPDQVSATEKILQTTSAKRINLFVRSIITKEASSSGWLHQQDTVDNPDTDSLRFPGDSKGLNNPETEVSGSIPTQTPPSRSGGDGASGIVPPVTEGT
ncbi:MAG: TIGR00341 family protein [Fimbriimonadaceae bacterium]|nr:MAG: TIGR00341 family protein [Fimbriimonadaceae bacterium]